MLLVVAKLWQQVIFVAMKFVHERANVCKPSHSKRCPLSWRSHQLFCPLLLVPPHVRWNTPRLHLCVCSQFQWRVWQLHMTFLLESNKNDKLRRITAWFLLQLSHLSLFLPFWDSHKFPVLLKVCCFHHSKEPSGLLPSAPCYIGSVLHFVLLVEVRLTVCHETYLLCCSFALWSVTQLLPGQEDQPPGTDWLGDKAAVFDTFVCKCNHMLKWNAFKCQTETLEGEIYKAH